MEDWGSLRRFVVVVLVLQLVTVAFLWLLNPVGLLSETQFALLLAADLVAFSIVSYVARHDIRGEGFSRGVVLAGSAVVMLFIVLVLVVEVV